MKDIFYSVPAIKTPRLILREIGMDDATGVFEVYGDPEVGKYNGWEILKNPSGAAFKIRNFKRQFIERERIRWGLILKQSGQLIGDCAFISFDFRSDCAEIGFNLGRQHWKMGLMTEALTAIISYGFLRVGIHRIEALVLPENLASRKLLERLGFQEEGKLRGAGNLGGEYRDLIIYGLLSWDWKPAAK